MARKRLADMEIKTESFVQVGKEGNWVSVDELNAAQKQKLATWIKTTYLNALYRQEGIEFYPTEEDPIGLPAPLHPA